MKHHFVKNVPNWQPSLSDYLLVFREVDGFWREISGNIPEFDDMVFADYLSEVDIQLPDDCTFCRVRRDNWQWEFKQFGGQLRIYFHVFD